MKLRKILIIIGIIISIFLLIIGTFILYLNIKSNRLGNIDIKIENNQNDILTYDKSYSVTSYNIGFGAYDRDYSFFMDEGKLEDGTKIKGKYGKGVSKENTNINTLGAISILEELYSDFYILEEVDTKSSRSYNINQKNMIINKFNNYSYSYAINFHSGFLPYPLNDMHGIVNSGLLTLSKYNMISSNRIELPIDESFFNKFFDLDRCLNLIRYKIGDKQLVMISAHFSAYDKGGIYRKAQLELLNNILKDEYDKGNYVIVGGDFNHDLVDSYNRGLFKSNKLKPEWLQDLKNDDLTNHYKIVADDKNPSCRDADMPYEKDKSFTTVVDGFIVSDNIEVIDVSNIVTLNNKDVMFMYSDHNPVNLKFKLKK